MPLNAIHIENMRKITAANGKICPASPSFYHKPQSIEEMVDTVVFRALELIHIQTEQKNWGD
jgi:4-hydroxy-3-polyprenylbenzoate decarboxylase